MACEDVIKTEMALGMKKKVLSLQYNISSKFTNCYSLVLLDFKYQ